MAGKCKDIIGKRFGRLLVKQRGQNLIHPSQRESVMYLCICDCGKKKNICGTRLRLGRTNSCGCLAKELTIKRNRKAQGQSSFNSTYCEYKFQAKRRGFIFDISKDEFKKITQQNCHYCGVEPSNVCKERKGNGNYVYSGIDRVNSSFGYLADNCVPCCGWCNTMKRHYTKEQFKEQIIRLYHYINKW